MARIKGIAPLFIVTLLIYLDLAYWSNFFVGGLLLTLYLFVTALGAFSVLVKVFGFSARAWRTKLFAGFASFSTLGFFLGAALLTFGRLTPLAASVSLLAHGLFQEALRVWASRLKSEHEDSDAPAKLEAPRVGSTSKILAIVYAFLAGYGFFLLYQSKSGDALLSPWQAIHPLFIYVFAVSTLILGLIIFFGSIKLRHALILLSAHAFLMFSYLPLSHQLLYGADQWRHMAVEERIIAGMPALINSGAFQSWVDRFNFNNFSYAALWSTSALLARGMSIDIIALNKWFMPALSALAMPALLLELGLSWGWEKRRALLLAWLGFLPFALQAAGSFTLPSNLGFLWWLFLSILLIKRLRRPLKEQVYALLGVGALSLFGYGLYFFLFLAGWILAEAMIKQAGRPITAMSRKRFVQISVIALIIFFPLLELLTRYSFVGGDIRWWEQIKQALGNFTGWYIASGPRPHDIATGNVFFNQTPAYAFVANAFIAWKWWVVMVMVVIFALAIIGLVKCLKSERLEERWLGVMSAGVWGGYIISRYLLKGEQVVARRMDAALALMALTLLVIALKPLYNMAKKIDMLRFRHGAMIFSVALASIAVSASYSLGPDTRAVGVDEYAAMRFVWNQEKERGRHCVLSETYPTLALEAISKGGIVGGGFPVRRFFSQPERVELYEQMLGNAGERVWKLSLEHTLSDRCWFVSANPTIQTYTYFQENSGSSQMFGDVLVWKYNK